MFTTRKRKWLLPGVMSSTETCGCEAPTPKIQRIEKDQTELKSTKI